MSYKETNPSQKVIAEFNKMNPLINRGLDLNWCEKTNAWIVLNVSTAKGSEFFATILVDRKRVA